jgi:acyl carrier protein
MYAMSNPGSVNDQVRRFITNNFYVAELAALTDEDSLLDKGIIDSTGVIELIGFLENTFGLKVDDAEMVPENLDSIGRISTYVERKQG